MEQSPRIPPCRTEVLDGVERMPRTGIKVVIVGGGIGGLMAALECWRKGLDVQVLERSSEFKSIGDFFSVGPSALGTLKNYPQMRTEYEQNMYDAEVPVHAADGTLLRTMSMAWNEPGSNHGAGDLTVSILNTRSFIAKMLLDQCNRLAIPVDFGIRVVKYSEDIVAGEATVETDDGQKYSGDVVIAADGIGTKSNAAIHGGEVKAMPTGYAILRKCFPRSLIRSDSKAASLFPKEGERPKFAVYPGPKMHLMLFLTHDLAGLTLTHPDIGTAEETWHKNVPPDFIISKMREREDWSPAVIDFFKQIPGDVIDWKLTWRDPQPVWTSEGGRILQLGDAAHSYLPTSGNGATQALEDALSIAECLRLGGRENVPWSTKVHERLRFKRTSTIQRLGFAISNILHHITGPDGLLANDPSKISIEHGRWLWQHRPEQYAAQNYALAYAHIRTGAPFKDTNLPAGYVYRPWTMEEELENERKGTMSDVKETGDWRERLN